MSALKIVAIGLLASCGLDDSVVVAHNGLGVTTLQTATHDNVFTLRAFAADGHLVGSVRIARGLVKLAETPEPGSEIDFSVAGVDAHVVTRETKTIALDRAVSEPSISQFLAVPEVTAALRTGKLIIVDPGASAIERPYSSVSCSPSSLYVTPTALQCCDDGYTVHFFGAQNVYSNLSQRTRGPYGPCTDEYGFHCYSDNDCLYGPLGFGAAGIWGGFYWGYIDPGSWGPDCGIANDGETPYFPNVTGSNPRTLSCGGGSGAGKWLY